ncbi:hypothetical protein WAI453_005319 [Rhynchosporium graminicola]
MLLVLTHHPTSLPILTHALFPFCIFILSHLFSSSQVVLPFVIPDAFPSLPFPAPFSSQLILSSTFPVKTRLFLISASTPLSQVFAPKSISLAPGHGGLALDTLLTEQRGQWAVLDPTIPHPFLAPTTHLRNESLTCFWTPCL